MDGCEQGCVTAAQEAFPAGQEQFGDAHVKAWAASAEQQAGFAPRCLGCECPAPVPAPSLSPSGLLLSASTFPQQQEHEIRYLVFKELNGETFSVHSCSAFNLFLQSRYISNLELERVASG